MDSNSSAISWGAALIFAGIVMAIFSRYFGGTLIFIGVILIAAGLSREQTVSTPYRPSKTRYMSNHQRGEVFELQVFSELQRLYPENRYIRNALFPRVGSMNEFFECDLIMFSRKGIFVIEIKNWTGMLYGKWNDKYWTLGTKNSRYHNRGNNYQYGYGTERVRKFYNPIFQNKGQINDLKRVYSFDYQGAVIFSESTDIQVARQIMYLNDFINMYGSLANVYNDQEIREVYQYLSNRVSTNPDDWEKHINRINYNKKVN